MRLDPARVYLDWATMARAEAARGDGIDAVAIVTPNHLHHPVAAAFLDAGIHVICDKPLATSVEQALDLVRRVRTSGLEFALTHNYTGYPMVRQAREMVAAGELGTLRLIQAEYIQDWLAEPLERTGQKQADWRTDPARSGPSGCIGDIGTHAFNLAAFIGGLELEQVAADLTTFVPGRRLEDNAHMMLRYADGVRGMLWASQVAVGHLNRLVVRLYGTRGALEFRQEDPNVLHFARLGESPQLLRRGGAGLGAAAGAATRIPGGHPEGYLEAFAVLYREFADRLWARIERREPPATLVPGVEDGARAMKFIQAALDSHSRGGAWVDATLSLEG